jgi:hypothetical protein
MRKKIREEETPAWIHRKQQEFVVLKNALQRFEWGSAYIPEGCWSELYHIRRAVDRMDEPMKIWRPKC